MSMPEFIYDSDFPDPAREDVDDLLAIGGDLSPERLIAAYSKGIFPWFSQDSPILWWSPDPRMILIPQELYIPRRLKRNIAQGKFKVSLNFDFYGVICGCAQVPRKGASGTWIVPSMIQAYNELHKLGYAHSVEVWSNDQLAGGIYGVALGRAFFGESMFFRVSPASKVALVYMVRRLEQMGLHFMDCQQSTGHMFRFGAKEVTRLDFLHRLQRALHQPAVPACCWQPVWLEG